LVKEAYCNPQNALQILRVSINLYHLFHHHALIAKERHRQAVQPVNKNVKAVQEGVSVREGRGCLQAGVVLKVEPLFIVMPPARAWTPSSVMPHREDRFSTVSQGISSPFQHTHAGDNTDNRHHWRTVIYLPLFIAPCLLPSRLSTLAASINQILRGMQHSTVLRGFLD